MTVSFFIYSSCSLSHLRNPIVTMYFFLLKAKKILNYSITFINRFSLLYVSFYFRNAHFFLLVFLERYLINSIIF